MNRNYARVAAGALALTLGLTQLPAALAAGSDTDTTTSATTSTTTPPAMPSGTGTPPGGAGQVSYSDVSSSAWYSKYVDFVTMRGIMTGTNGKFSPNASISRGAFILALYNAAGSPTVSDTSSFKDVSSSSSYAKALAWAKAQGIATGDKNNKFQPNAALNREMAMTFLYRALGALNVTADTVSGDPLASYTDSSSVSSWATAAMKTLAQMEVLTGSNGKLNPHKSMSNAEAAAVLYRLLGGSSMSAPGGAPGGSSSSTVSNGTAATTISEDGTYSGTTYTSTGKDENALRVDGATVTLDGITVNKTAGATSSTENGDFYGMNAGLLALNKANVTIKNATVATNAQNGNGVFSYGTGTTVNISDSKIRTSKDNSGGIQTTGGGTTNATNLDVETQGNSSAAIRSDRGGGTVVVDGGTYVSNGTGSPAIYCTANITAKSATLTANNSEAVVVEGKNSVALTDCNVTGNMSGTYKDSSENIHNIMIYQSMSGDADQGEASFSMTGGTLTAKQGDMIYVTNTQAKIALSNVKLTLANGTLLNVAGNSSTRGWGTQGKNGGTVVFTADNQALTGNILCDSISSLDFAMQNASTYSGAINPTAQGGTVNVTVGSGCTWTLTSDCYITKLTNNGTINYNGHTIHLADGTTLTQ